MVAADDLGAEASPCVSVALVATAQAAVTLIFDSSAGDDAAVGTASARHGDGLG